MSCLHATRSLTPKSGLARFSLTRSRFNSAISFFSSLVRESIVSCQRTTQSIYCRVFKTHCLHYICGSSNFTWLQTFLSGSALHFLTTTAVLLQYQMLFYWFLGFFTRNFVKKYIFQMVQLEKFLGNNFFFVLKVYNSV